MGTAKRERQKANRKLRLEELAKERRKAKSKRVGLWIGGGILAVVALVGLVTVLSGDDESATGTTTTVPDTLESTTTTEPWVAPAKPEVVLPTEIPTTLHRTTLREGTGTPVVAGDTIDVYYVGVTSADGVEFDENYTAGFGPFTVAIGTGRVIPGWDEGLVDTQLGGQYQLDIPADMAYGDNPTGGQPAGALSFVVDIVGVTAADGTHTTVAGPTTTAGPPEISEFTYGTGACPEADGSSPKTTEFTDAPELCIDPAKQYTATFETSQGTIVVELDMSVPGTVNNFVTLARYHYYDDTIIFRTDPSIDIIQGGGRTNTDTPGYTIPDEGTGFTYTEGKLSMARTSDANSAGGQWFFVAGPNASVLDGQGTYVNFGDVTEGIDVVKAILALAGDDGQTPTEEVQLISVTITES
ncbi:MAG: peptidylprolyl isomerase [Ilumatobacter sp.]|nr:peptidylprolyl isomerase [Ilumatobacter sp.]